MTQDRRAQTSLVGGKVYHPLLNVVLPGTTELRARCADSESIQVLDAACRLAELRCRNLNVVRDAVLEHSREPFIGKSVQVDAACDPELIETDILRALLALQQKYLAAALFDPDRSRMPPSESFDLTAEHWREALERCPPAAPGLPVLPGWARRWALMFLENSTLQIGVSTWVRSVMHVMPSEWSDAFVAGLVTDHETHELMDRAFREYLKTRADLGPLVFPKCPPAYFDRHGLLEAANDLLTSSKGIFLLGNDEGQLQNLIRAISSDVNYCPNLQALEDIRGGGGRRFSAEALGLRHVSGVDEAVFALTGNVPEEAGGQAWCLDPSSFAYEDQARESLEFFKWLVGEGAKANVRYVISMNRDEWTTLVQAVPEIAGLPSLDVPAAEDLDIILAFVTSLPEVLERHNCSVPLGLLFDFLYQTSLSHPAYLAIRQARTLVDLVRPDRTDLGLLNVLLNGPDKRPFAQLSQSSFPIKIRVRSGSYLAAAVAEDFSKYIGDGLESLIVLYETVTLLSEPAPGARIVGRKASNGHDPGAPAGPDSGPGAIESSYVRAASALPLPTAEQTARFASFVAEAHSWYKHLPLYPTTPFFFFLDPTAGMKPQGFKVLNQPDFDVGEYREKFGHWNYRADKGRTLLQGIERWRREGSLVESSDPGSTFLDIDGKTLKIPCHLVLAGMAKLSAFVHHRCPIHIWANMARCHILLNPFTFGITLDRAPEELPGELRAIWACLKTPNWYPPFESGLLAEHDARVAALTVTPDWPASWHDESGVMKMARELGGERFYEQVLFAVELRRTTTSTTEAIDLYGSSTRGVEVRALIDHLVYERMRQIKSMKDAMNRFIRGLV